MNDEQAATDISAPPGASAVEFVAADGTRLAGRFFAPAMPGNAVPVLVCGATGVPQRFYVPFAAWLAKEGFPTLLFDYRGIGDSLFGARVKDCRARKQDWGEQDMPAALDCLRQRTGAERVDLIGHSAGAQLVGLMPNRDAIRRVVMVAGSTGYVRSIRFPTRIMAEFFLRLYLPLTARVLGYAPARRVGFGEDLPAGVALQWARWCRSPGYIENAFGKEVRRDGYDEFRAPILALYASDDPIATPANVQDLLRLFPQAPRQTRQLDPQAFGYASIGHIDYFRRGRSGIWPQMTEWLRGDLGRGNDSAAEGGGP
jgi:predicted alpha/beta hydrolase